MGIVVLLFVIGTIANMAGCIPDPTASDDYKAGREIGFADGNMAMQQGRLKESDAEKDAAAWAIASQFTTESQQQKQDWVNGFKQGWDAGYASH
jgi:hypothetical protein